MAKHSERIKKRCIELRQQGFKIKEVQEKIKEEFKVKVSYGSISEWFNPIKLKGQIISSDKNGQHSELKNKKLNSSKLNDEEYLLKQHGYDPLQWEITSSKHSEWDGQNKNDGVFKMYASKISVKPRKREITDMDIMEKIKKIFENDKYTEQNKEIKIDDNRNKKYAVINIRDFHFGLLSWKPETTMNYDHKIAKELYIGAVNFFAEKLKKLKEEQNLDKIILVQTDDFFHFDNKQQTTAHGTAQDADVRVQKMLVEGTNLMKYGLDVLSDITDVYAPTIIGNHDTNLGYSAQLILEAWFQNKESVTINTNPFKREYLKLGQTLIGFSHGDESKKTLKDLMVNEAREKFGKTKFHEMHLAHLHSESSYEESGVMFRRMRTLCASSSWEKNTGYNSSRGAQMFVYDEEYGLETMHMFTPDMIQNKTLVEELNYGNEQEVGVTEL